MPGTRPRGIWPRTATTGVAVLRVPARHALARGLTIKRRSDVVVFPIAAYPEDVL